LVGQRIRQWWQRPDSYEWLSAYVTNRGLQPYTRIAMGLLVALGSAVVAAMIWSPSGPPSAAGIAVSVAVVGLTLLASLAWLTHWPRRAESTLLVVVLNFCISAACLVQRDPKAGVLGGFVFAILAGYVAFFHTPKYLASVALTAFAVAAICGVRLAAAGDPALAACIVAGLTANTLVLPISIRVLVVLLGEDSAVAHLDPLTELPNRRGFERTVRPMLARQDGASISVILIDLDNFKRINDTHGHAAGDRVLMEVGEILLNLLPDGAVAARIGGEEFVVAAHCDLDAAMHLAERLRLHIAAKPWRTTASLGVARVSPGTQPLIEELLVAADQAMYTAKRDGGNRVYRTTPSDHRRSSFPADP
jgi:diguanylate cyclase (GGDEF)-like protein